MRLKRNVCSGAGIIMFLFAIIIFITASFSSPALEARTTWTSELVHRTIKSKNPDYNDGAVFVIEDNEVVALDLSRANVDDLSFLKEMTGLNSLDMRGLPVKDLTPLSGLQLKTLGIEDTQVEDLTPLEGMPIEALYLNNTKVKEINVLSGMPLKILNLYSTEVRDIRAIETMKRLEYLWLNETQVEDISPLSGCPLVSLTLHKTKVKDLQPLADIKTLQRLHIAETEITDLTPIKNLKLSRLIYTPNNIIEGNEIPRQMGSLREIGTTFENRTTPKIFWQINERGDFKRD
ncbi:leucine-rich repeat domain-containing protein [Candidatus Auribacterota bacterium]